MGDMEGSMGKGEGGSVQVHCDRWFGGRCGIVSLSGIRYSRLWRRVVDRSCAVVRSVSGYQHWKRAAEHSRRASRDPRSAQIGRSLDGGYDA